MARISNCGDRCPKPPRVSYRCCRPVDEGNSSVGSTLMMFCNTGMTKANVLPVPVRACARLRDHVNIKLHGEGVQFSSLHVNPFQSFVNR